MLQGRTVAELTHDYLDLLAALRAAPPGEVERGVETRVEAFYRFVCREGHKLRDRPVDAVPLMLNQPLDSPVHHAARACLDAGYQVHHPWLTLLHPPASDTNPALVRTFAGHTAAVTAIAVSRDGRFLLSGGQDAVLILCEIATSHELRRMEGHSQGVTSVAFSPDGERALSGSDDQTVRLWDLATGGELRRMEGHSDDVTSVAFSPDGQRSLSGSHDQTVRLWDLAGGRELRRMEGHSDWVTSVAFSTDGRWLVSASNDRTLRIWSAETGESVALWLADWPLNAVAISGTGPWKFVVGDSKGQVLFLELTAPDTWPQWRPG